MATIEQNWDTVAAALKSSIELVAKYGYNRNSLQATNAIIPIAYFLFKNQLSTQIVHAGQYEHDRKLIMEWLARVLLKGTFGGQPDAIYPVMRNLINQHPGRFPLEEIIEYYRGRRKSISFSSDDIESILDIQYGSNNSYSALSLLYSSLNFAHKYHQDHIHPRSFFTKRQLNTLGITDESLKEEFISRFNKLPNLQLLQANANTEKKAKPFSEWLNETYPNQADRSGFLLSNHINLESSLEFGDFLEFYDNRRTELRRKLVEILNVRVGEEIAQETDSE